MDSLTQIVLGSAVAYTVAGKQAPKLALLAGAVIGTLPDLDVLVQYADPLRDTVFHRTWSHSWIVHSAIAPILAFLASRMFHPLDFKRWFMLIWLCLTTHSLLDSATIYGTHLFWPLPTQTIMQGAIFIIDPLYTLPLLVAVFMAWFTQHSRRATKWIRWGLVMSTAYLCWALLIQQFIQQRFERTLAQNNISSDQYFVTPTPLNTMLWRVVALDGDQYVEGVSSIFDSNEMIKLTVYPRGVAANSEFNKLPNVALYQRFSHSFFVAREENETIFIQDLRMGIAPNFVFEFAVAKRELGKVNAIVPVRGKSQKTPDGFFGRLLRRIFDENQNLEL